MHKLWRVSSCPNAMTIGVARLNVKIDQRNVLELFVCTAAYRQVLERKQREFKSVYLTQHRFGLNHDSSMTTPTS